MSKHQQRITTPYNMGYQDALKGGRKAQTNRNNQYNMGYKHGLDKRLERFYHG